MTELSCNIWALPAIPATAAVVILEAAGTVAAENPVSDSLPSFPSSSSSRGRGRGTSWRGSFLHTNPLLCWTLVCAVPAPSPRLSRCFRPCSRLHVHYICCLAFRHFGSCRPLLFPQHTGGEGAGGGILGEAGGGGGASNGSLIFLQLRPDPLLLRLFCRRHKLKLLVQLRVAGR